MVPIATSKPDEPRSTKTAAPKNTAAKKIPSQKRNPIFSSPVVRIDLCHRQRVPSQSC